MLFHSSVRVTVVLALALACRQDGDVVALGAAATAALSAAATPTTAGAGGARAASSAATREARATPTDPTTATAAVGETVKMDSAALLARGGGKYGGAAAALNGAAQSVSLFGPEEKVRTNALLCHLSLVPEIAKILHC